MTYKYALLKKEDKLVVYLNEEEKPISEDYFDDGFSPTFNEQHFKSVIMHEWQSNHKRFEIHEDYIDEFIHFAVENYEHKYKLKTLIQILSQGIVEIPPERIGIEIFSTNNNPSGGERMAILLPEPAIKESLITKSKEKYCDCKEPLVSGYLPEQCGNCGEPLKEESQDELPANGIWDELPYKTN